MSTTPTCECGKENVVHAKFCMWCGRPMGQAVPAGIPAGALPAAEPSPAELLSPVGPGVRAAPSVVPEILLGGVLALWLLGALATLTGSGLLFSPEDGRRVVVVVTGLLVIYAGIVLMAMAIGWIVNGVSGRRRLNGALGGAATITALAVFRCISVAIRFGDPVVQIEETLFAVIPPLVIALLVARGYIRRRDARAGEPEE